MTRYRDTKTGRLVSAAKWKRSKAHGETRYKRERAPGQKQKTRKKKRKGPKAPPEPQQEFVLHFDYGSKKARNLIRFQVHIFGPKGAKDKEVLDAVKGWEKTGELPKGWKQIAIDWTRPPKKRKHSVTSAMAGVERSALLGGKATVRKGSV